MDEQMRRDFENWYSDEGKSPSGIERSGNGTYKYMGAQSAWVTWNAAYAAALSPPAAQEVNAELLEALKGVLRVADRETVEFDAARAAIAKATA